MSFSLKKFLSTLAPQRDGEMADEYPDEASTARGDSSCTNPVLGQNILKIGQDISGLAQPVYEPEYPVSVVENMCTPPTVKSEIVMASVYQHQNIPVVYTLKDNPLDGESPAKVTIFPRTNLPEVDSTVPVKTPVTGYTSVDDFISSVMKNATNLTGEKGILNTNIQEFKELCSKITSDSDNIQPEIVPKSLALEADSPPIIVSPARSSSSTNIEIVNIKAESLAQMGAVVNKLDTAYIPRSKDSSPDNAEMKDFVIVKESDVPNKDQLLETEGSMTKDKLHWRDGMEIVDEQVVQKTMFISKDMNKDYEKDDAKYASVSYKSALQKLFREIDYFTKIMDKVGDDIKGTEYKENVDYVLKQRTLLSDKLLQFKVQIDEFILSTLSGDIKSKPVMQVPPTIKGNSVEVEYVYPSDKKPGKESGAADQMHRCADCNVQVLISNGQSIDDAMLQHSESEDHKAIIMVRPLTRLEKKQKEEKDKMAAQKLSDDNVKSGILATKLKRAMLINRIVPNLIDDELLNCLACGNNFSSANDSVMCHVAQDDHCNKLNSYNERMQKDIMLQYPELFGMGRKFHLTELHTVVNKVFVDPVAKFAYCGLCCKELPSNQQNIDAHIKNKAHDKLLIEKLSSDQDVTFVGGQLVQKRSVQEVATAEMVDLSGNMFDVADLEKLLESKDETKIQVDTLASTQKTQNVMEAMFNETSNLSIKNSDTKISKVKQPKTVTSAEEFDRISNSSQNSDLCNQFKLLERNKIIKSKDGKFICLTCDVKGMTSAQSAEEHTRGNIHRNNLKLANESKGVLSAENQQLLVKNCISVTYGKHPLIFRCVSCDADTFAGIQAALEHIATKKHTKLLQMIPMRPDQKAKSVEPENISKRSSSWGKVVLHRNRLNYWCFACKLVLADPSEAFAHVAKPGHYTALVDEVRCLGGTQYYCEACLVHINGEKNACQHIMGFKHRGPADQANNINSKSTTHNNVNLPTSTRANSQLNTVSNKTVKPTAKLQVKEGKMTDLASQQSTFNPEKLFLEKNGIVSLPNGTYNCNLCGTTPKERPEIFLHIASPDHGQKINYLK